MMAYPVTGDFNFSETLMVSTTVALVNSMQVANSTFYCSSVALQVVTLNQITPVVTDLEFNCETTKLKIDRMVFTPATPMVDGNIMAKGEVIVNGKDPSAFEMMIMRWSN